MTRTVGHARMLDMSKAGFKRMMRERRAVSPLRMVTSPPAASQATAAPAYQTPTDEQLANFVSAMVGAQAAEIGLSMNLLTPRLAELMLRADPAAKRGWLQRHREFQELASRL